MLYKINPMGRLIGPYEGPEEDAPFLVPGHAPPEPPPNCVVVWRGRWDVTSINRAPALLELEVTSLACDDPSAVIAAGEVTCRAGSMLTAQVVLKLNGVQSSITSTYRMPLRSRDGREKIVLCTLTDGEGSIEVRAPESGVWSVSEAAINEGVSPEDYISFSGLKAFTFD